VQLYDEGTIMKNKLARDLKPGDTITLPCRSCGTRHPLVYQTDNPVGRQIWYCERTAQTQAGPNSSKAQAVPRTITNGT